MSITFEQLLTDPKYREMSVEQLEDLIISDELSYDNFQKGLKHFNIKNGNLSPVLFEYLQKLNAESEKKAEPNDLVEKLEYTKFFSQGLSETSIESPIISHINAIQMGALIEKVAKEFNKPVRLETLTKEEHPIQITDQKAREICAKYFNCPPNELKILHP